MSSIQKDKIRASYQVNLEKATIISLLFTILMFNLFPRFDIKETEPPKIYVNVLNVEDIPVTHQGVRRKPPPKPTVPIPSDDEIIPEDVTIEQTDLNLELTDLQLRQGLAPGKMTIFQPRPILEVIPEYPQELQKKGIQGYVKLHLHIDQYGRVIEVVILENSTGSEACAQAAKAAALKGRYIPAKRLGKPTDIWITRVYTFGLQ